MELLRQWLTGVTCAAIIVALADSLMAGGTVRRIGRLAGGLLLLAAVVKPVLEVDLNVLSAASLRLEAEAAAVPAAEEAGLDLMKSIIGEETGAYILDKAAELGISCQEVRVTCAVEENGVPYPASVVVLGDMTQEEQDRLSRRIEADLAIPAERQTYETGGGGG